MQITPLLTEKEAARILGWSVFALQQRRFHGKQPAYVKLGTRCIRYEISALQAFVEKGRITPDEMA